jgi:ASPM-SPD-2-Hydin domain-containing protein/centrosomal CEP192-like protein
VNNSGRAGLWVSRFLVFVALLCMQAWAASPIAASSANLSFGTVAPGGSNTRLETLTNHGTISITISQTTVSNAAFRVSGLTLPLSLAGGHSVTFKVVFVPRAVGMTSGNLLVRSTASNPQLNIALSGVEAARGKLTLAPATLNFGRVTAGSQTSLSATLTATGDPVTLWSVTTTNAEFKVSGIALPLTIPPGHSVPFTVTFAPQSAGSTTGRLAFTSNALNSPADESVAGGGAGAAQHSVTLSWAASSTTGVVGYNVYRSAVSGGPYARITSGADPSLSYTDSAVTAGQSYFYVVTAVRGNGIESTYSNQAKAVIP